MFSTGGGGKRKCAILNFSNVLSGIDLGNSKLFRVRTMNNVFSPRVSVHTEQYSVNEFYCFCPAVVIGSLFLTVDV